MPPGGRIAATENWVIEHCLGPLGLGTLILKPRRHVTAVADLNDGETDELGPLLRQCSQLAAELIPAEQVYNTLWSHSGAVPGHVHYVIQPVTRDQVQTTGVYGPALQMHMFMENVHEGDASITDICDTARRLWAGRRD
ncbi:hypothetical protein OG579_14400 [Williamsia herbipolensis]|uniref:Diadenosine tetraphosphate (Ap4A) hydrolase n=1 Tax=Williamsia herbipolensis TaxID=1603258 RepID=A0AAU4JYN9_9NOCA|nr:hypothetical protein [Williamsia herbipolensis]